MRNRPPRLRLRLRLHLYAHIGRRESFALTPQQASACARRICRKAAAGFFLCHPHLHTPSAAACQPTACRNPAVCQTTEEAPLDDCRHPR